MDNPRDNRHNISGVMVKFQFKQPFNKTEPKYFFSDFITTGIDLLQHTVSFLLETQENIFLEIANMNDMLTKEDVRFEPLTLEQQFTRLSERCLAVWILMLE